VQYTSKNNFKNISIPLSVFHVLHPEAVKLCNMVIIKRIKHLAPILAAADQAQLAQSAQLMRHSGLRHFEMSCKFANVPFAFQQNGNEPQPGGIAKGAEQVS
jgi:hypothetical protein